MDDGAGTIVKSNNRMYWGHKASVLGFPEQGVALDAIPVTDSSTHDSKTIYPHVVNLLNTYPELKDVVDTVLYDSAADDSELKKKFKKELGIDLKVSLNPRRKKEVSDNLSRGICKLTPYGYPVCLGGYELDYQGMRIEHEKYIYKAPLNNDGVSVCLDCIYKSECCPGATYGRVVTISFDLLPHIDSNDPPMAKRFKALMSKRPSVERMIKRLKCDLSDSRLSKTGNKSFKAYLDKTLIGYHILVRH